MRCLALALAIALGLACAARGAEAQPRPRGGEEADEPARGAAPPPGRHVLAVAGALVHGALVHGTGHYVLGDTVTGSRLLALEGEGLVGTVGALVGLALTGAAELTVPVFATVAVHTTFYGHVHSYYAFRNAGIPAYISGGGGAIPQRWDGIGRHFLRVDVDPAEERITTALIRVDEDD